MNLSKIAAGVVSAGVLALGISVFVKHCDIPINPHVSTQAPQASVVQVDSTTYLQQEAEMADTKEQLKWLQDSLEQVMEHKSHVTPTYSVVTKEVVKYKYLIASGTDDTIQSLRDRHSADSLLIEHLLHTSTADSINLLPLRVNQQWLKIGGTIAYTHLYHTVVLDSVVVPIQPTVVFGTHMTLFGTKITALVGDQNPYVQPISSQTFIYQPKQRWYNLVIGPAVLYNGSGWPKAGIALTLGYRIF